MSLYTDLPSMCCKSFTDVQKLSVKELNRLSVFCGIDVALPKSVRLNAVCHCLGLSTTGSSSVQSLSPRVEGLSSAQQEEFDALKPAVLYSLPGWTSEINRVPLLDDGDVKKYLLKTNIIDANSARMYKLTRPYQLKHFVHSMAYHELPASSTFCAVRGLCNPSQSTNKDDMKMTVILIHKQTGQPYGGYCTCTVGYCASCGHIGAMLFCLSDFISTGLSSFPSLPACTDSLCKWTDPKGAEAKPTTLKDMNVLKSKKVTRFQQKSRQPAPLDRYQVMELRSKLLNATASEGVCVPAVHALSSDRFVRVTLPSVTETMPVYACELTNPEIVFSTEIEVADCPLPVALLPHKLFLSVHSPGYEQEKDRFVGTVSYTSSQLRIITSQTVGQIDNLQWHLQRMGSITSSNYRAASRSILFGRSVPKSLILKIQNYEQRNNRCIPLTSKPSLKWGIMNETNGRAAYLLLMSSKHCELTVEPAGLIACKLEPYLRASPDGIVKCSCHAESWLLEVKCPWTARHMDPKEAVDKELITYIKNTNDSYQLVRDHPAGYFEQVQGAMAAAELTNCDFVVWTPHGALVLHVPFDIDFWNNCLKPPLVTFFHHYIVPEILTERVRCGYPLFDGSVDVQVDEILRECIAPEPMEPIDEIDSDDDQVLCDFLQQHEDSMTVDLAWTGNIN